MAAAAAAGTEQATTYRRLYELLPDPYDGEYAALLTPFSPDSAEAPAALRDAVFSAARTIPHVFLYLTEVAGVPVVRTLHRPTKYAATLGLTTPWDNQRYVFASDVTGGLVTTVGWPTTAFNRTPNVRTSTLDNMDTAWTGAAGADCLGPYAAGDANTEEIRTRYLMPVPPAYAHTVLGRSIVPRDLWAELGATIIADGRQVACAPLLNWLRVASTYQPPVAPDINPGNPVVLLADALVSPLADDRLNSNIRSWILEDLPALNRYEGSVGESMVGALALMRQDAEAHRAEEAAAREEARRPKTVTDKYPFASQSLRMYCGAPTDEDLPIFWKELATVSKHEGPGLLQQLLNNRARAPSSTKIAPVVTPALYERLAKFQFGKTNADDLTAGLSPFLVVVGEAPAAKRAEQQTLQYSMLHSGHMAPTMSQLTTLVSWAPAMPASGLSLLLTYQGFATVLDVAHGIDHKKSQTFRDVFLPAFASRLPVLETTFKRRGELETVLQRCLRHTQLASSRFDAACYDQGPALTDAPNYMQLVDLIDMRAFAQLPHLPAAYVTTSGHDDDDEGAPPTATGGTQRTRGRERGAAQRDLTPVTNTQPNATVKRRFDALGRELKDLTKDSEGRARADLPMDDAGTTALCFAFHLRCRCIRGCERVSTHRQLTSSEDARMNDFLTAEAERGKSHLADHVSKLPHPSAKFLEALQTLGARVEVYDPVWTPTKLQQKLNRGPHKSAYDHAEFVRDEMASFCEKGFWTVLPFDLIKDLPHLRLSPLGAIPQRDRRPRLIVDLSFYGVNQYTNKIAPSESMQFGKALERILYRIRHANPKFGPVYMSKVDISDGFYRIWLQAQEAPALAVVLPQNPGEPSLVAIPLTLPMGWVESPPNFCAATETVADLANHRMHRKHWPPHRLEKVAETKTEPQPSQDHLLGQPEVGVTALPVPPDCTTRPLQRPLSYTDVYVDDFLALCQGNKRRRRMVTRVLLHTIDEVFAPYDPTRGTVHQEPASVKKLLKGDAAWTVAKVMLGWLLDTVAKTIQLPQHRYDRLHQLFADLHQQRRTSVQRWHKLLGELRSMVLAIPGGKGLFSILQTGFTYTDKNRIRIDRHIRAQLEDFEALAKDLVRRPTRLSEIIPDADAAIGAVDASKGGMGGVWFTPNQEPILWRAPFPLNIQAQLVSYDNPNGVLTNTDLELAGNVAHPDVLVQEHDAREATVGVLNDNFPAVTRAQKGSVTTREAGAYLLRLSSTHQRHYRYLAQYDYVPGGLNQMADDTSRLWHLPQALATVPPATRDAFGSDLCLAQKASRAAVVPQRAISKDNTWLIWVDFCLEHDQDPLLSAAQDKIPYLQVFAQRYRDGRLAKNGQPVKARTVEDALRCIGQTMATLGADDIRLVNHRTVNYRLKSQLDGYKRDDPEPTRVKPIPLSLIRWLNLFADNTTDPYMHAIADMATIAVFFLCRPGEYVESSPGSRSSPFRLQDIELAIGTRSLNHLQASPAELHATTSCTMIYTDQKNAVRGEKIMHGASRQHHLCPKEALVRRILHLRQHHAAQTTPLYTYYKHGHWHALRSHDICKALKRAATALYSTTNLHPDDVTTRGLRAGGAMALLCAKVDSDIIRLVGRWRSDEMIRYLHAQCYPLMKAFAHAMATHGQFSLLPAQNVPQAALHLLDQVPVHIAA